jgi:CysZ protein
MAGTNRRTLGFFDGVRAPFAGLGFIVSTPGMWPLALVPVVVVLALTALLGWGGVEAMRALLHAYLPALASDVWWAYVVRVLSYAVAVMVAAVLSVALAQPLSGPALERIVRAQERALGVREHPDDRALASMLRSVRVNLVSLLVGGVVIVVLLIVDVAFPPATVVTVPLKFVVSAFVLSWDVLDYPLGLRQRDVGQRLAWFRTNFAAVSGFGLALSVLFLVPCAGLLLLPAGVAGGARLVVRTETT